MNDIDDRSGAARRFVAKAVTKAMESELLAAAHYRRLAEIAPDRPFAGRAAEDAAEETRHAAALERAARRDGIALQAPHAWRADLDAVHEAFEACARRGDVAACLFVQDVFLEVVAITLYETLRDACARTGADALRALVEKVILPDERLHLAVGFREIARLAPERALRAAAFRRAATAIAPAMAAFSGDADVACARTCAACDDRCLKLDACAGDVPLAGGWARMVSAIEAAARRLGIDDAEGAFAA